MASVYGNEVKAMVSAQVLQEATKRLVERFHPQRIILFGSQARGTAHVRSDVDLLVISSIRGKRHRMMVEMDRALSDLDSAFEVVILTPEEFDLDRQIPGTIGRYASLEGRVLYERS
jgi:predicted nucleotidyltransferase